MKSFLKMCEKWHTSRPFGEKRRVPQESLSKMNNFDFLNDLGVKSIELHFSGDIDDYSRLAAMSDILRANYGTNPWQEHDQVVTSVSWVSVVEAKANTSAAA